MPKRRLPPVGFWSYTRRDDQAPRRQVSVLKALVEAELQVQLGQEVQLFQDVSDISHGARWEPETRRALESSTFFIPVLTPSFLQSEWCCREVAWFLERQERLFASHPDLPRTSRIFPIHFIDIDDADAADERVLVALKELQFFDFREMRHLAPDAPEVQRAISRFAASLCKLLRLRVEQAEMPPPPPPPPRPTPAPPAAPWAPLAAPAAYPSSDAPPEDSRQQLKWLVGIGAAVLLLIVAAAALGDRDSGYATNSASNYSYDNSLGTDVNLAADLNATTDVNAATNYVGNDTGLGTINATGDYSNATANTTTTNYVPPDLYVDNQCPSEIVLRILYPTAAGYEDSSGTTWTIAGNTRTQLLEPNRSHVHPTGSVVYFHAASTDGGQVWSGQSNMLYGGQNYPMRRYDLTSGPSGHYVMTLTCQN